MTPRIATTAVLLLAAAVGWLVHPAAGGRVPNVIPGALAAAAVATVVAGLIGRVRPG